MEHNCTTCASFRFMDELVTMGWCMLARPVRVADPPRVQAYDGAGMGETCRRWTPRCRECGDPATHGWRAEVYCAACAEELRRLSNGAHHFYPLQK